MRKQKLLAHRYNKIKARIKHEQANEQDIILFKKLEKQLGYK